MELIPGKIDIWIILLILTFWITLNSATLNDIYKTMQGLWHIDLTNKAMLFVIFFS